MVRGLFRKAYATCRAAARSHPGVYRLVRVVKYGPFVGRRNQRARAALLKSCGERELQALNLGSGGRRLAGMVNLDVTTETGPDLVGDGFALPFRLDTFDVIFCEYVIEHVGNPAGFLKAVRPHLKPDGVMYLEVPFLQPLHGAPHDYTRWTRAGFARLLERSGYEVAESGLHMGAGFTVFWICRESFAGLLSFGVGPLRAFWHYVFGWLLSPVLLIDFLSGREGGDERLANGFFFFAKRRRSTNG